MLLFKKKFLDAILSGEKTQTLRKRVGVRTGQRSYVPGAGYIQIDGVEKVFLAELTDADAVPDGFPDLAALKTELQKLYGEHLPPHFYRIRFHLLPPEVQQTLRRQREEKKRKPPAETDVSPAAPSGQKPLSLHSLPAADSGVAEFLSEDETAQMLRNRCMVHRSVCDWGHEPGKSQDFFSIFLKSPRDARGVPTLDGYALLGKVRRLMSDAEWEEGRWIVAEVCRAWAEWQYAVERFFATKFSQEVK